MIEHPAQTGMGREAKNVKSNGSQNKIKYIKTMKKEYILFKSFQIYLLKVYHESKQKMYMYRK